MFEYRRQPFKALYKLYFLLSNLFYRLPVWTVQFFIPLWRPRRNWSLKRSIVMYRLRSEVDGWFRSTPPIYFGTMPDAQTKLPANIGFVWVDSLSLDRAVGEVKELARINDVQPVRTCGYFYCRPTSNGDPTFSW